MVVLWMLVRVDFVDPSLHVQAYRRTLTKTCDISVQVSLGADVGGKDRIARTETTLSGWI